MRFLKLYLLSNLLPLICIVALWFIYPSIVLKYAVNLHVPEAIILTLPQRCQVLVDVIKERSAPEQSLIWPSVESLVRLENDSYLREIKNPPGIGRLTLLLSPTTSTTSLEKSQACLKETLNSFSSQSANLIDLYKSKNQNPKWAVAVLAACKNQRSCAERFFREYQLATNVQNKNQWLEMITQLGSLSATLALEELKKISKLGFSADDTHKSSQEKAIFYTRVFVQSQLQNSSTLLQFITDENHALPLRWRAAMTWAQMEGPRPDLWPVADAVMKSSLASESCRREALLIFGPLWNSHQELVSELSRQIYSLAERLPSSQNPAQAVQDQIVLLKAFSTSQTRSPQSVPPSLSKDSQKELAAAVASLALALRKKMGPRSNSMDLLMETLRQNQLFEDPSEVAALLLRNPETLDLGMTLLKGQGPFDALKLESSRTIVENLPRVQQQQLIEILRDTDLVSALIPMLSFEVVQKMLKGQDSAQLKERLALWSSSPALAPSRRLGYKAAALSTNRNPSQLVEYRSFLKQEFQCENPWLKEVELITSQGFQNPAFAPSVLAVLNCQNEQIQSVNLARVLLDPVAQKIMQKEISMNSNISPLQLKKLSELYSRSNQVPGSAMPTKIKRQNP